MLIRLVGIAALLLATGSPLMAQQSPSSSSSSSQSETTITTPPPPAAPKQQQQPPNKPPSTDNDKKESTLGKVKQKADDLIPYCIGIGSIGKCRHDPDQERQARREAAAQALSRQCRDAAEQSQPETPACADLRKQDAAHDVDVGDTYFGEKSYNAAAMRYRSALQTDPTNATAILHLAQALEKLHRKPEAAAEYQKYLATNPPDAEAKKARAALEKLGDYRPAPVTN
jgi:tetratricopeptide (TPR) repeat protein